MSLREALVDLDAIRANVAAIARATAPAGVMAVVKADAYGHGLLPVARAAREAGAAELGVADLDEALALRAGGVEGPILCWLHSGTADFAAAAAARVDLGVSTLAQLEAAAAAGATVQIKTDSGLSRNGATSAQLPALLEAAVAAVRSGRVRVRGVFSHLANTSEDEDRAQLAVFRQQLDSVRAAGLDPEVAHLSATAGALSRPEARLDLVRVGIGMYGLSPFAGVPAADLGLRPAMRLSAEVVSVKSVPAGSGVSYGFDYRTRDATRLALVAIGYADGVPRQASNAGPVVIGDGRFRVAGRVAMDQFVVDVGDARVRAGERAVLFGDPARGEPSADEWADAAGTINYEIVTRIGPRVQRRYAG